MNAPHTPELAAVMDAATAQRQIDAQWDGDIVRQLTDYIAIPAKSLVFDPAWAAASRWCAPRAARRWPCPRTSRSWTH